MRTPSKPNQAKALRTLDALNEADVRRFVGGLLLKNDDVCKQFLLTFPTGDIRKQLSTVQKDIAQVTRKNTSRGFIIHATKFWDDIHTILQTRAQPLIWGGHYREAFELVCDIFDHVRAQCYDEDDSWKLVNRFSDYEALWHEILENCSASEKTDFQKWFEENKAECVNYYFDDILNQMMDEMLSS